jgi:hypothetical protein
VVHGLFVAMRRDKRVAEKQLYDARQRFTKSCVRPRINEEISLMKGLPHRLTVWIPGILFVPADVSDRFDIKTLRAYGCPASALILCRSSTDILRDMNPNEDEASTINGSKLLDLLGPPE